MSVYVSCSPRHYSKRGESSNLQNPPKNTCTAVCLERKFIASRHVLPVVDVEKLSRTIPSQGSFPHEYFVSIYKDRLLFQTSSKGLELPDIHYDDIIQIEFVKRMRNTLFILTGRHSFGTYSFFRFSDSAAADYIKDLVRKVNPNAKTDNPSYGSSIRVGNGRSAMRGRQGERTFTGWNDGVFRREKSFPWSASSRDSIEIKPLSKQNTFVHWDGKGQARRQTDRKKTRKISGTPAHSSPDPLVKTDVIKADANGRRKRSCSTNKRRPLVLELDEHSQLYELPLDDNWKRSKSRNMFMVPSKTGSLKSGKKSCSTLPIKNPSERRSRSAITIKPNKRRFRTAVSNGFGDSDGTIDLEIGQMGRNQNRGRRSRKRIEVVDNYDWDADSWDGQAQDGTMRGVSFNLPRRGGNANYFGDFDYDDVITTSEDSLYLEQEQQYGIKSSK